MLVMLAQQLQLRLRTLVQKVITAKRMLEELLLKYFLVLKELMEQANGQRVLLIVLCVQLATTVLKELMIQFNIHALLDTTVLKVRFYPSYVLKEPIEIKLEECHFHHVCHVVQDINAKLELKILELFVNQDLIVLEVHIQVNISAPLEPIQEGK